MISQIRVTLAVISATWLVMLSETATSQERAANHRLESAVKAKSPRETADAYQLLFSHASATELQDLIVDKHVSISLRGAWEHVRRTVKEGKLSAPIAPDTSELHRFLGFVEGRLAVPIPERWERSLLSAMAHKRDNVYFHVLENSPYRRTEARLSAPKSVSVRKNDGGFLLDVDEQSLRIPADIVKNASRKGPIDAVNTIVDGDRCYVALHSDFGLPYQVHCFEIATAKLLWSTEVWAAGGLIMYTGMGFHWADLVLHDKVLYVFGVSGDAAYIEGFATMDGNNQFRFSTSY